MPDGVIQEVYGYLCVHYAITVADAFGGNRLRARPGQAVVHPIPAGRSANHRQPPGFFPLTPSSDADQCVTAEILHELLPARRARANPRVVKRKMSVYQVKHPTTATRRSSTAGPMITALK